jgi:hypothetical protein
MRLRRRPLAAGCAAADDPMIEPPLAAVVARCVMIGRFASPAMLLACLSLLSGCGSVLTATTADVSGIAGAGISSAVTKSPTAAAGIGLGVAAGADAGLQIVERDVHAKEQDRIAAAAGPLNPGQIAPWSVTHTIPIEADQHGEVTVTRLLDAADFDCKDIIFSVETMKKKVLRKDFYTATVCRDGTVWKWALAEPATARWGSLQ